MKCAIYTRVSTDSQETENQVSQLRDYANKQGWQVVEIVKDVASGGKAAEDREGLTRIFELAEAKQFDILLFWSLDRLSREGSRKTLEYLTVLDKHQVKWQSLTEPYFSSLGIFADAVVSILAALARQEKIRISERTIAGLARVKAQGKILGRRARDGVTPERAKELRAQGLRLVDVAREMGISIGRASQLCNA